MARLGGAGQDRDQRIDGRRHFREAGVVAIGGARVGLACVVDDRHLHRGQATGDGHADAAETGDADGAVAQGRPRQRIIAGRPFAGADMALGGGKLAHGHQQQAEGGVRDLFGQHVGRVRDDDAAGGAGAKVDAVIADAEIRDDLELRQPLDQLAVDGGMGAARDAADGAGTPGECGIEMGMVGRDVAVEDPGECGRGLRWQASNDKDVDFGHALLPGCGLPE